MASYIELHDIRNEQDFVRKVYVGICDVCLDILVPEAGATTARTDWAKAAIKDPVSVTPQIIHYVLLANKAFTSTQILNASDATVKSNVATAVTKIIGPTV